MGNCLICYTSIWESLENIGNYLIYKARIREGLENSSNYLMYHAEIREDLGKISNYLINHVRIRGITFPLITENASLINATLTADMIYINK